VCSNSSADRPARRLLAAAFATLRDEAPAHHGLLCDALAELTVHIVADGEHLAPRPTAAGLAVAEPRGAAAVTIRAGLATVLALLEARRTLVDAIARGELDVWGSADALDAAADAFATFLHGMVRAPSSAGLVDELRRCVAQRGAEQGADQGADQGDRS